MLTVDMAWRSRDLTRKSYFVNFSGTRAARIYIAVTTLSTRVGHRCYCSGGERMLRTQLRPAFLYNEHQRSVEGIITSFRQFSVTQQVTDQSSGMYASSYKVLEPLTRFM